MLDFTHIATAIQAAERDVSVYIIGLISTENVQPAMPCNRMDL